MAAAVYPGAPGEPTGRSTGNTHPDYVLLGVRAPSFLPHAWAARMQRGFCISPGSITSQVNFQPVILSPRITARREKSAHLCPRGLAGTNEGGSCGFLARSPPPLIACSLTSEVSGLAVTQRSSGIATPSRGHRKSPVEVWPSGSGSESRSVLRHWGAVRFQKCARGPQPGVAPP